VTALTEQTINGERVLVLADVTLVASCSEPGTWHHVQGGRCDCKGFTYRGKCRHLGVADEAYHAVVRTTAGGWEVVWAGRVHGGRHGQLEAALDHAAELNAAGDGEARAFLAACVAASPAPQYDALDAWLERVWGGS